MAHDNADIARQTLRAYTRHEIRITIDEAASRFSHWIDFIGKGEEVVVLDHEQPVARITRCEPSTGTRPQVGTLTSAPARYA